MRIITQAEYDRLEERYRRALAAGHLCSECLKPLGKGGTTVTTVDGTAHVSCRFKPCSNPYCRDGWVGGEPGHHPCLVCKRWVPGA